MDELIQLIATIIAVALVMSLHEFAHGFIALKCGDDTAKINGRVTLNPIVHFDLIGFLCLVFFHFGWAKPVPINSYNFNNRRKGIILVSIAGIVANLIFAFISYPIFILCVKYLPNMLLFDELIKCVFYYTFLLNLTFAIFNFIPVFPLDGFNFLFELCPARGKVYEFLRDKAYLVLLGLMLLSSVISHLSAYVPFIGYFDIFGYFMSFTQNVIAWPITRFWNLFF